MVLQTHSVPQRAALALQYVILPSFWQAVATAALDGRRSPLLHWAGRRRVRTFKRRFGISRRLPLDEPFSADHVQAKAEPSYFWDVIWSLSKKNSSRNDPEFGTILVPFFGRGTLLGNDFFPFARLPCSASWARKNEFCGRVQMKQVLAVRVGSKKAVGHIV